MSDPAKANETMKRPTVTAVVVSYNVRDLLVVCLKSLAAARARGYLRDIIVVDSASHDGSPEAVRQHFPEIRVIDAPNRGYGAGANRGIEAAQGDYVLILNPDTIVPAQTVERLTRYLRDNPDVALCAPRLRYPDGTLQPSRRRFPGRLTPIFESTIFHQLWPSNPWSRNYQIADRVEDAVQDVDWVVGAALLVRTEAMQWAGMFDESFWMYCEEIEWCWRFQRHGWRIAYVPDVDIMHHEGASTSQDIPLRQIAFDRSRIELQRRLYGRPTATTVALGIKLGYLIQMSVEGVKWLVGHRRTLRRQRVAFYRSLLLSSMRFTESQNR